MTTCWASFGKRTDPFYFCKGISTDQKRFTSPQSFRNPSKLSRGTPRAISSSNQGPRASPSSQTPAPSRRVNSLLDFLISCHKGVEVEPLGLDIEYGVESKKASVSSWRPRLSSDPENKAGVLLEMVGIQEVDVMPASPSFIEVFAKKMLINFAFGSRFEPMTEPRFKVMDYRSSSVTLSQGLASPMCLEIHKA